jgi:glycosyltransferase involved in cell wall biosynthesis
MIRILVDSLADVALTNAQMVNAREIVSRLDPERFHVTTFFIGEPDPRVANRPATRLLQLPERHQTPMILAEFLRGRHDLIFYLKSSPATKWFLRSRRLSGNRCPVVGTIESQCDFRNEPTLNPEAVRLWEQTVLRCDYLFANSRSVQRSLQHEYGVASEIVPQGVDTEFFAPDPECRPNQRPRVLFVGSLRPFKGPQIVLEAAARFPAADFVLVGDGTMAGEVRYRARNDGLKNVQFPGPLPMSRVRDEYRRADIFFFPSKWEGSPKVILEAAACALPVIASGSYQPETVVHGRTGFVATEPDDFFAHLEKLLDNPQLRRELGRAGRAHAQTFDWGVITRRWEEIFERLVGASTGKRRAAIAASF